MVVVGQLYGFVGCVEIYCYQYWVKDFFGGYGGSGMYVGQ